MIIKKIAKLLRGSATPAQIMMACMLGAAFGFVPSFSQSPALVVLLILLLVILNANLALAAMATGVAKVLSYLLLPVSFGIGRVLLDGPTRPLFEALVNAPVAALCGFEYYATTGGVLLGLVLGAIAGALLVTVVKGVRARFARLEEGSASYNQWMSKWWVRLLIFVLIGRGSRQDYATLIQKRGRVIRPVGLLLSVLVVVLLVLVQSFFAGPIMTMALQRGLERVNGATVDLADARIDLAGGRMTLSGLAMADPNALEQDLFRAETIEADVSTANLLRKRLMLDRVVIAGATHGAQRTTPGRLVGAKPAPVEEVETRQGEKSLDEYLKDARRWHQRLAQVRRWLEKLSGPEEPVSPVEKEKAGETLADRLRRQADTLGYARVAADHLIEGAPTFTVRELLADGVRSSALAGETLEVRGANLSTHPGLLREAPSVTLVSSGDTLGLALELGAASGGGGANTVSFHRRGLAVDSIARDLRVSGDRPISGGTMDVSLQGSVTTTGGTYLDMPLRVTLRDTAMTIGGNTAPIDELTIPLGLRGPIDNPRIRIDDKQLADALVAAGANALAREVRSRADEAIQEALSDVDLKGVDLKEGLGGLDLKKGLDKLKGDKGGDGSKPESDKKQEDEKKKKAGEELKEKAKDLTEGLFGKKKKDGG